MFRRIVSLLAALLLLCTPALAETAEVGVLADAPLEAFLGDWVFLGVEVAGVRYSPEELHITYALHLSNEGSHITMNDDGVETTYALVCVVDEVENVGTMLYAGAIDPENAAEPFTTLPLVRLDDGTLAWLQVSGDVLVYFLFAPAEAA